MMRLTNTETAETIQRQYGGELVPVWKMRRIFDDLSARGLIDLQRVGIYRTIGYSDVWAVADELRRIGWLPAVEAA